MANIKVTFVLPYNVKDESESSHVMQQAYNSCKEFVKDITWKKESDLKNHELSKGDYLVFEEICHNDFSSYTERQCVVISPLAISVCLVEGKPIPNFPWPISSVSMYGCEVSCSQLPKSCKESVKDKVQLMGGLYSSDLTNRVTHLICGSSNSEKYRLALERGVLLMLPTWIDYMYESSLEHNVNCHDKKILNKYKCPPFQGLTICATGLTSGAEKAKLMEIIKNNGGNFKGALVLSQTDVLICYGTESSTSDKYKSARRVQRIWCVTPNWIYDSVEKGYAMPHDLEKYRVKTATSTPTKAGERMDPNFSTISAVGQLSICQRTRIDETVSASTSMKIRSSCKRKADDLIEQLSIKKVMGAGHFLDGCSVFMVGFSPTRREKLNKIINMSGATRYDDFSDRVTHVIVGDSTSNEMTKIKENCGGCHLVTLQWLLDSIESQEPVQENDYLVTDLDRTDDILTKEVVNLFREDKTISPSRVAFDPENDDALTQKYLKTIDTLGDVEDTLAKMLENQSTFQTRQPESLAFQPQNTSTQISQATTDISESSHQIYIFENLKLTLQGFDAQTTEEINSHIVSDGGTIVDKGVCDYAIVPIVYNPSQLPVATEIVNELWLHESLEERTLITDIQYYHRHIARPQTDIFDGCVISPSVYTNFERQFLKSLILSFGGIFQEQFSKKSYEAKNVIASTHLIGPEASGKKYEAAIKWNLPVITKDWLLACIEAGEKVPLDNYLVGTSDDNEKTQTPTKIGNATTSSITSASNFKVGTSDDNEKTQTPTKIGNATTSSITPASKFKVGTSDDNEKTQTPTKIGNATTSSITPASKFKVGTSDDNEKTQTPTKIGNATTSSITPASKFKVGTSDDNEKTQTPTKIGNVTTSPKTPASNFKPSSQVTPINKILQDAIKSKVLPTPPSPKQYYPWDPKTPDTPLGCFIRPNPSPALRKEMQKYVNSFPDFVPPKRRDSTPLSELRTRLVDKVLGRGEYSQASLAIKKEIEPQQPPAPHRLSFEDNEDANPTIDNSSLHQKLQDLQKMVKDSANNTPRRSTWNQPSSELLGIEKSQSQVCTVNWDYEEEKIQDPSKKYFLLSGVTERDRLTELITSLGGQYVNSSVYVSTVTHLICMKPGRNEKTLSCMAAGKWILHVSYLEKSAAAGRFLNEEEFEFGNPKAKKNTFFEEKDSCICYWRKEIGARGYGAFHDMRAIIIAEKKELLARVIQSGGGVMVNVEPPFNDSVHATHCLLEIKSVKNMSQIVPLAQQGIKCVNTIYVNDFLWRKQHDGLDCIVPYFRKYYK